MAHDSNDPHRKSESVQTPIGLQIRKPWQCAGLAVMYVLAVVLGIAWVLPPAGSLIVQDVAESQPFTAVARLATNEAMWPGMLVQFAEKR